MRPVMHTNSPSSNLGDKQASDLLSSHHVTTQNQVLRASSVIMQALLAIKGSNIQKINTAGLIKFYSTELTQFNNKMQQLGFEKLHADTAIFLLCRLVDLTIQDNPKLYGLLEKWKSHYFVDSKCSKTTANDLYKVIYHAAEDMKNKHNRDFIEYCFLLLKMINNHHYTEEKQDLSLIIERLEKKISKAPAGKINILRLAIPSAEQLYHYLKFRKLRRIYLTALIGLTLVTLIFTLPQLTHYKQQLRKTLVKIAGKA